MINGFEHETEELKPHEVKTAHLIAMLLAARIGKENAITNGMIREIMERHHGLSVEEPRIRKMINYIRNRKLVVNLLANSKGYYVSNDIKEVKEYVQGMYARAFSIKAVADSFGLDPSQLEIKWK
jgi:hypothetical protein